EASVFLTKVQRLPLAPADVARLAERTEGWIAGLQLAALAMRGRRDLADFVAGFGGSNRFVSDYLAAEILARLPLQLQHFVLQTSILNRLCGPLCDAVLGLTKDERRTTNDENASAFALRPSSFVDSDSQALLEQLERANLFIVPLDDQRRWYRYHQLFAEV